MNFKYCPDISNILSVEFRPHMIECAYGYYVTAVSSPIGNLNIKSVICALAVEIILKSFNSKATGNHGKINETYKFNKPKDVNPHNLLDLYEILPDNIKPYLVDCGDLDIIKENKDIFIRSRYEYEDQANIFHSDCIIKLSAIMICKVVYLYRSLECDDPFIASFNIENFYLENVQSFLVY